MLRERFIGNTEETKFFPSNFETFMKKITSRKFEYEGTTFALEDHTRYRGYKLNRTDKHTSGASYQDMNLDINATQHTVYTEIGSSEQFYKLSDEEYQIFTAELEKRCVQN